MALKLHFPFPIFAPLPPTQNPCSYANPPAQRGPREVRFSRWNNANAERFNQRQREQKEIEDDIRRHRRFEAATRITKIDDSATATKEPEAFKSIGTPSSRSAPSIPGKKSKYSKPPDHPAFRLSNIKKKRPQIPKKPPIDSKADVKITQDGVSYVIDGAPFEFKYSYTETPKVKPLKLREPPFAPFGPTTMPRPWTGRAPLPPSKKKLKEFDSFELPPPNKKGVKPVQKPGPYLPGTGPRYVYTREEILGEPLTSEEITDLVNACIKSKRQLNMGRDGLTHNMLDNIHAHWKRRRVCKIKCKGVCTVDMDNVCEQLEDKTGGKVIYRRGGVLYLFRGRNYNYKTRPRFPLMLWKPVTPVYPRLIQRVPEGLTLEEVTEMRKKGRELIAICKLAKNGLYSDLVKNVREAFEVCELVQINCQGIKGSDYRKIGAKLKDLVPCVLISFENEHILMWRGRNWKSSFPELENEDKDGKESVDAATSAAPHMEDHEVSVPGSQMLSVEDRTCDTHNARMSPMGSTDVHVELSEDDSCIEDCKPYTAGDVVSTVTQTGDTKSENRSGADDLSEAMQKLIENENFVESAKVADDDYEGTNTFIGEGEAMSIIGHDDDVSQAIQNFTENESIVENVNHADDESDLVNVYISQIMSNNGLDADAGLAAKLVGSETILSIEATKNQLRPFLESPIDPQEPQNLSESLQVVCEPARTDAPCMERVLLLRKQAVETGSAVVLDDATLDADSVYERAVALSRSAPPGPVFRRQHRRKSEKQEHNNLEVKNNIAVPKKRERERQSSKPKRVRDVDEDYLDVVPQGSLRVDELAKLLA